MGIPRASPSISIVNRESSVVDWQMFLYALLARAGASMVLSNRNLRRSVLCLLVMMTVVCAAQVPQFQGQIDVELTGGRVTSFVTGTLQYPINGTDILYINAPTIINNTHNVPISGVLAGEYLNTSNGGGLEDLGQNHIFFAGATSVVAAVGQFAGSNYTDYAFALNGPTQNNLCVYYGTGNPNSSYNAFIPTDAYIPTNGTSGCMTVPVVPGGVTPNFAYIAAIYYKTNGNLSQLMLEDSANNELYIFSNNGTPGGGGLLYGFTLQSAISLASTGGAGPIYIGDFNGDGNTDFIINGQTIHNATVFLGNGSGVFTPGQTVPIVNSMLLQDMNGDGKQDLVAENGAGAIEIFPGTGDGAFGTSSIGGTTGDPRAGNGGQLADIAKLGNDQYLDILTATPIGLSVLQGQGPIGGSLTYTLRGIYNIGPGRSSYALAPIFSTSNQLDFAVDSPEGVAIVQGDGNGDGGFMTSQAYSALAPALGATVGQFRNVIHNQIGCPDVAVTTGAVQGQLLTGNTNSAGSCNGTFSTFPGVTNTANGQNVAVNTTTQ